MDTYYKKLCVYAFSLVQDHTFAEDIVQNVFVKLWTSRDRVNPNISIKNFLYRSVYNEFIDHYRKKKPVIYLEKQYLEIMHEVAEQEHENLDALIRQLNMEIENLPSKSKQIFLMNKKEGLTHVEIAEYLNISMKTVESHMTKAFKFLSKKLHQEKISLLFLLFKLYRGINCDNLLLDNPKNPSH